MDAEPLVGPIIEHAGLELVDLTFEREAGRRVLRVVVDSDEGVDLNTLASLSRSVSEALERSTPAHDYTLEVSSPGLEHPLRSAAQFRRAIGERVQVRVPGSAHEGTVVEADGTSVVLDEAGERLRLSLDDIASARTVVDWDAELKGSTR